MSEPSAIQPLATAISKLVDREAKKRGYSAAQVCGALGAVAGATVAANLPENGGVLDHLMLGAVGLGFEEVLKAARTGPRNVTLSRL